MKNENVIDGSHDLTYCQNLAKSNEEKTGNPSFVKHLGPANSHPDIPYQKFIVYEIVTIDD